jgi:hypothetical protein
VSERRSIVIDKESPGQTNAMLKVKTGTVLYASHFAPDSQKKWTESIVSTNSRKHKVRNERLPYDCCVVPVAAVPVGGVREGEEGCGEKRVD